MSVSTVEYDNGPNSQLSKPMVEKGGVGIRQISPTNTALVVVVDLCNLNDMLSIDMAASGGTATLTVESSVDGTNWRTVDAFAAAATKATHYFYSSVGASLAVSPVAFRFCRITAGAAGVGNTTTLNIAAK